MLPSSNALGGVRRVLAWRPGGYLRASGVLFCWLVLRMLAQLASGCWRPLWRNPCLQ